MWQNQINHPIEFCKVCGRNLRSRYCVYKHLKLVEENDRANAERSDKKTTKTE